MAVPQPSEEERRLLREFRLTSVPSLFKSINVHNRSQTTSPNHQYSNSTSAGGSNSTSPNIAITTTTTPTTLVASPATTTTPTTTTTSNQTTSTTTSTHGSNHGHHHHHHHHKHHGHSGNHRRHKSTATSILELTADELNRMSELVSELGYLKLVSPKSITTNGNNGQANNINLPNQKDQSVDPDSYIFQKVDYIKKINIRRKAFKKLKARNNHLESQKIKS